MPHYKDLNNQLHYLDSAEFEHLLPAGCVAITDAEADVLRVSPPPSPEQIIATLENTVQIHLDREAQAKGYDNIVSACSYAAAPNPFQAESISFLIWRAAVWTKCYQTLAAVQAGAAIPTEAELIDSLPTQ